MPDSIAIRLAQSRSEIDAALAVRRRVFVDEQGIDPALESDGRDASALHAVAVAAGAVVGTARLLTDGDEAVIARVAVLRAYRRRGAAARLVGLLEAVAADRDARRVTLHPHGDLEAYYARLGYTLVPGSRYTVGHHEVLVMEKRVAG